MTVPNLPVLWKPPEPERPRRRSQMPYSQEKAEQLCDEIAGTTEPIRRICLKLGIPRASVYRWRLERPDFSRAYNLAMWARVENLADECLEIADDSSKDMRVEMADDGAQYIVDKEVLARTALRLNERHYLLAKLAPRKFGTAPDGLPDPAEQIAVEQADIPVSPIVVGLREYKAKKAAGQAT